MLFQPLKRPIFNYFHLWHCKQKSGAIFWTWREPSTADKQTQQLTAERANLVVNQAPLWVSPKACHGVDAIVTEVPRYKEMSRLEAVGRSLSLSDLKLVALYGGALHKSLWWELDRFFQDFQSKGWLYINLELFTCFYCSIGTYSMYCAYSHSKSAIVNNKYSIIGIVLNVLRERGGQRACW